MVFVYGKYKEDYEYATDDLYFIYELNDKFCLYINYSYGKLKKENFEDVARAFYNQITAYDDIEELKEEKIEPWIMNDFKLYPKLHKKSDNEIIEIPIGFDNEYGKLKIPYNYVIKIKGGEESKWIDDFFGDIETKEERLEIINKIDKAHYISFEDTIISLETKQSSFVKETLKEHADKCALEENNGNPKYIRVDYFEKDGIKYFISQENAVEEYKKEVNIYMTKDDETYLRIIWTEENDRHAYIVTADIENIINELNNYITIN